MTTPIENLPRLDRIAAGRAPSVHVDFQSIPRGDGSFAVVPGKPKIKLTPAEFARALGVSPMTARRWLNDGTIEKRFIEPRGKVRWWILAEAVEIVRQGFTAKRLAKR